jgi:hypothetical protein
MGEEFIRSGLSFEVRVVEEGRYWVGWVYLGDNRLFTFTSPKGFLAETKEQFAGLTLYEFSERLSRSVYR